MKKNLLAFIMLTLGLNAIAQTPRMVCYEEFTGETCPPCASTNPGLNTLLLSATNATRVVAIKWQVPIPSAPSNLWSLYQTDKIEIDWRWRSVANGGYGYVPPVTGAPQGKINGKGQTAYGASSDHPANMSNNVINTAANDMSSFNITMSRAWSSNAATAVDLTVTILATAPYSTTNSLVFRNIMVERLIQFSVQSGSNGEKNFEDAARMSYPTLQAGTTLTNNWIQGQSMTFTMNCVLPSYVQKKSEVAFVGLIQNEGTRIIEQCTRADKQGLPFDAVAVNALSGIACSAGNTMAPTANVKNDGLQTITDMTITPYVDGVAKPITQWTGNLAPGASTSLALTAFSSPTVNGSHTFSYNISALNSADGNTSNNSAKVTFFGVASYPATPIVEGFSLTNFPYSGWAILNPNNGTPSWSRVANVDGFNMNITGSSLKYDFYNNTVIGDKDELYLPPIDLSGSGTPSISFDLAYRQETPLDNDALELFLSDNCGSTWTSVWNNAGSSMAANQLVVSGTYNSPSIEDWRTEQIALPNFNKSNVLAKFVVTNDHGNNLYIDNINLSSAALDVGLSKNNVTKLSVNVFPNPTNGITNIQVTSNKIQLAKLTVVNSIGQIVLEKQLNLIAGTNNTFIDMSSLANGIYSVNIEGDNVKSVSKISISK